MRQREKTYVCERERRSESNEGVRENEGVRDKHERERERGGVTLRETTSERGDDCERLCVRER